MSEGIFQGAQSHSHRGLYSTSRAKDASASLFAFPCGTIAAGYWNQVSLEVYHIMIGIDSRLKRSKVQYRVRSQIHHGVGQFPGIQA